MAVNKIILVGNVGKDPEVRTLLSGKVANFSLATTEKWKDRNGEKKESTEWHRCSVFGSLCEVVEKYVKQGSQLYVEGSIHYDKADDGKVFTNIRVSNIQMLGKKESEAKEAIVTGTVSEDYEESYSDDMPAFV